MADQSYFAEGSTAMMVLEGMVDAAGLRNVLYALSHICGEKAAHLRHNWQDERTAKVWDRASRSIDRFAIERITV